MHLHRLHLLPGALFLLVILTFIATYCIAVFNEHVKPDFPYISDTGTEPPESCIFGQFINIAAFLLVGCVYVRYLQVEEVQMTAALGKTILPRRCNKISAFFGFCACLGLDLVANFQETNVLVVHMIGAFICFFSATIYFIIQTYISRKLMPNITSPWAFFIRVSMSVLCIVFCLGTVVPAFIGAGDMDDILAEIRPGDDGWAMHLVSTICEWSLVLCFCIFILSFSGEFYGIELQGPILKLPEPKSFQTV